VIKKEGDTLILSIQDNGKGFELELARQSGGMGLQNMTQRAQKIDARLEIITAPGAGTTIIVTLPLHSTLPIR
jgi:signal transduction histidine kinase